MEAQDKTPALSVQIGGGHYKDMPIQPFEYIHANGIPWAEGCVIKYVSRWRNKAGIQDLKKARHFLDLLIEAEERKAEQAAAVSDGAQPYVPWSASASGISIVLASAHPEHRPELDALYQVMQQADLTPPKP